MAIEKTIVIKGDTSDAEQSFESLGKTIQEQIDITIEFEKELQDLEQQLKDTPKGSLAAQKDLKDRITGLKSALDDQKVSLKSLNNEKKKANKITKTSITDVRDNGGAIATLDALTGGLASRVRDAAEATKLFNFSLKGMRTALIATGIGALVVALGLVVAYWDDIVDLIKGANRELESQLKLHDKNISRLEMELSTLDKIIKLEEKRGNNIDDLKKKRESELRDLRAIAWFAAEDEKRLIKRLTLKALEADFTDRINARKGFIDEEEQAAIDEAIAKLKEYEDKIIDIDILLTPDLEEEDTTVFNPPLEKVEGVAGLAGQETLDNGLLEEKIAQEASLEQTEEFLNQQTKLIDSAARIQGELQVKWADLAAQEKLAIAGAVLQDAAKLVDQNSVAGKGIAIAQTGINTAQGIMQAFATLPTIAAIPAAAIVGALGIKSTIDIVKQKIPSATGRGFVSGGVGGGASAAPAPAFNLVEGTSESQIDNSINLQNNEPVQAVVVSGDVTTAQSVDRNIVRESGI